jgi:hypothetical protein
MGSQITRPILEHDAARVFQIAMAAGRDEEFLARFHEWRNEMGSLASGRLYWRGLRWMLRDAEAEASSPSCEVDTPRIRGC